MWQCESQERKFPGYYDSSSRNEKFGRKSLVKSCGGGIDT
jgi:hypothetical protein